MSDALRDGKHAADELGGVAGSFVPTIVNDVGDALDAKTRKASGFTEQIQKRIPGLRNSLPESTDPLGRPIEHSRAAALDPFSSRTARDASSRWIVN